MIKTFFASFLLISTLVAGANAATSTLDNGLVGYYQFSGNANDSSGQGNSGTASNVSYTADRYGNANCALLLNGSTSYVSFPDSVFGPATQGFTFSAWVQPNAAASRTLTEANWVTIIEKGSNNGEANLEWTGTAYQFGVKLTDGNFYLISSGSVGTGLAHVVCVYQQGVQASLWINGQLVASLTPPNEDLYSADFVSSSIGAYGGENNFFTGVIDDVRIYNRALSTSEVQELFAVEAVTPWLNAADLGNGWVWSSWFGSVNLDYYPWAYHAQHGWMYVFGTDPSNLWIYNTSDNMGFLWTSSSVYPWLWSNTELSWLYYEEGTQNPRWFFNWNNQAWEQHNP